MPPSNVIPFPATGASLTRADYERAGVTAAYPTRARVVITVPYAARHLLVNLRAKNSVDAEREMIALLEAFDMDTRRKITSRVSSDHDSGVIYIGSRANIPAEETPAPIPQELFAGPIIGLIGKAGSGKDTTFHAIASLGIDCRRFAFGDPLKEEVAAALGITVEEINADKARFRTILQWWGTEWRRQRFGEDYWVRRVAERIGRASTNWHGMAVITDVRFPNEVEYVRRSGGKVIQIIRPDASTALTGAAAEHSSENAVAGVEVDATLFNNGTPEHLSARVSALLHSLGLLPVSAA